MISQNVLTWTLFGHLPQYVALEYVFGVLVSLLVGSFLNVVVYRLPIMMEREWQEATSDTALPDTFNLAVPRSTCPSCGHVIRWYENIPVLSYLLLRGKCSECQTKISMRYPLVELFTGVMGAVIIYAVGFSLMGLALLVCISAFIVLALIDYDHMILPDSITLPLMWLGIALHWFGVLPQVTLSASVMGAMAGYLSLWAIYWLYRWVRKVEGLGYGDFKLFAAIGAWGGALILPQVMLLAAPLFLVSVLYAHVFRGGWDKQRPAPFGPALAIAGMIIILQPYVL